MSPRIWRALAVAIASTILAFIVLDIAAAVFASADPGFELHFDRAHPGTVVVDRITDPSAFNGKVAVGDHVHLEDLSLANRLRFLKAHPGDRFVFRGVTKDGTPTRFVDTLRPLANIPTSFWVLELTGTAFGVVGLVIALRSSAEPAARTLVALLLSLGVLFVSDVSWLPLWTAAAVIIAHTFSQVYCPYAALALATTFPRRSAGGVRRWLELANPWLAGLAMATIFSALVLQIGLLRPSPPWMTALGLIETFTFFAAIAIAFVVAGRGERGADRKRVLWVAWTIGVGFSGSLAMSAQFALHVPYQPWEDWTALTLLAIPLGLAYAIVRHRVVDIGFVVNRALVFGSVSAIVVVAFTLLEWVLSNAFVRVSHITSTSLELALALALGFSLRTIHARVDRLVDDIFFRDHHEAERSLRTLAREVAYVTDPRVAVARVHAELLTRTRATFVAIYVVDGSLAVRIDPAPSPLPESTGIDDPALVRMRATRSVCDLHRMDSALAGDHAFPMLIRDTVTGFVVLGPATTGEAFAPDEVATVEALVLALGNALDALQTAALKAEIARVLAGGAPLETLRRTVDPAAWVRGPQAQPAGSLAGLGE